MTKLLIAILIGINTLVGIHIGMSICARHCVAFDEKAAELQYKPKQGM